MKNSGAEIIEEMKGVLEYYMALGIERLPSAFNPKVLIDNRAADTDKSRLLNQLISEIGDCMRCRLSQKRKKLVFGEGNPEARLMFIGEAPGREEDIQGLPFVGDAGMLLTRLIEKMGFKRSEVYIANVIKCRPPMNRDPEGDEIEQCRPFVDRQVDIIRPEIIITLGRIALQSLMNNTGLKISMVRGHFLEYKGIPVMPTFHPAYLLRNPKDKWLTWSDMQKVVERLN